ncbi:hypothetical protein D5086_015523 [Populus alba]
MHSRSVVVTLVIRGKGGIDDFFDKVLGLLERKGLGDSDGSLRLVGVAGILRKEQEMWQSTGKGMQEAFQDLNALLSKVKEMVMLAEKMRQKLLSGSSSQSSSGNDEEMGSKEDKQEWL